MKKFILFLLFLGLFSGKNFATFNSITDGDPVLATPIMQNFRHVNYGNVLKPVDANGNNSSATLDIGSSTVLWRDGWFSRSGFFGTSVGIGTTTPIAILDVRPGAYSGNYISSRYNSSNYAISFASTQLNGAPYIGFNTKQTGSSDGQSYDLNGYATTISGDAGAGSGGLKVSVAPSGTAGNTASFVNAFVINGKGRVGIGITNPGYKLEINDSAQASLNIKTTGGGLKSQISLQDSAGNTTILRSPSGPSSLNAEIGTTGAYGLNINTSDTARITISSTGIIGIGTTAPTNNLQVSGNFRATNYTMTAQPTCIIYNTTTSNAYQTTGRTSTWNAESYDPTNMHSTISNTERITIASDGVYITTVQINIKAFSSGKNYYIELLKNGSVILANAFSTADTSGTVTYAFHNFSSTDYLKNGDYLTSKIYDLDNDGGSRMPGSFMSSVKVN